LEIEISFGDFLLMSHWSQLFLSLLDLREHLFWVLFSHVLVFVIILVVLVFVIILVLW